MEYQSRVFRVKTILLSLIILLVSNVSYAQTIYKWKDKNGKLIYSDTPPENKKVEEFINRKPILPYGKTEKIKYYKSNNKNLKIKETKKPKRNIALCKSYRKALKNVNAKLRKGYSQPKTGERWRKERKKLNALIRGNCG